MKVLFAIKTLVHSVGGAEKLVSFMSGAMAERGLDIHLLTFDRPEDVPFFNVDARVQRHFSPTQTTARKTRFLEYPGLLWRLRKEILTIKPDVVLAFMHSSFVPLQCALLGTSVKVILSEHTAPPYYKTRPFEYFLVRFFSLFAHSITIVSQNVRDLYPFEMRRKMDVLPNPVVSDYSRADVEAKDLPRKAILNVGRLNKDKDHQILIEAFASLADEFQDWDLKLVGSGPEHDELKSLVASKNMQGRIFLLGSVDSLDPLYASVQLFVMPSKYESFGLVTAEAMTHGLPVIGFKDCSGTNELIHDGKNGFLIETRGIDTLAKAMRDLMRNPSLRAEYGNAGYAMAKERSPDVVADIWTKYVKN